MAPTKWVGKLVAFGLALLAVEAGSTACAECKLTILAEIPVVVERQRILIPSEINGQKAFFVLDTGAGRSLMFSAGASKFKVPTRNVTTANVGRLYGIGGEIGLRWGEIDSLKLGSISMSHAGILVGGDRSEASDIVGIIGYDVFARHDIEFDLAHQVVRLLKSAGCSDDEMDYWHAPYALAPLRPHGSEDSKSYVDVQLNAVHVEALLDTGSPQSTVTLAGAARAGVRPGSPDVIQVGQTGGVSGDLTPIWAAHFASFGIGEEKIANPTLTMADLFGQTLSLSTGTHVPTQLDMPAMLVGLDFFRAHHVIISRDHNKLYFSYNGGPIFEPPSRRPLPSPPANSATTPSKSARPSAPGAYGETP